MAAALLKLSGHKVTITSDEGKTSIQTFGKRVLEDQPTLEWSFDGKTLYVRDRTKHLFVSGRCTRHRAIEVVSKVTGKRVDVFTRSLLLRRVPLGEAFVDATVRIAGYVAPGGVPCDILRADSANIHTTIFVRRADHLPQSVTTESVMGNKILSSTERTYSYAFLSNPKFVLTRKPYEKLGAFPVLAVEKL
jgi:hypothetical protein